MQKLGILASVLLLASAVIGPIGFSYAQTADTATAAKAKNEEGREKFDQMRADRLEAQKQMAADIKAKMLAKKMASAKAIEDAIAARNEAIKKGDLPTAADVVAKIKADAKAAIEARKSAGGPSDSQTALEKEREAFAMKVKAQKDAQAKSHEKDVKRSLDEAAKIPKVQKDLGAADQKAKEEAQKAEADKAAEIKKDKYGKIHYNRK